MKQFNLKQLLLTISILSVLFTGCTKDAVEPTDPMVDPVEELGKYENGFFLIHEGWFGHGTGSVSYYDYTTGKITDSVFQKENPGKNFEPTSSTVQYGAIFNKNLYIVSKVNGPVVVADAKTLKEVGRIPAKKGNNWRAFTGIDENKGLLSSSQGVYIVNLKDMSVNLKLAGLSGQAGDMLKTNKHVFVHTQKEGSIVYNVEDLSIAHEIKDVSLGFVETPNKKVWFTTKNFLVNINTETFKADSIVLPFTPASTWSTWFSSPIIASTSENAIFLIKAPGFGGGKELYKYVDGDITSLEKPFIITAPMQSFYKKNLGFDKKQNQIVTTTIQDGYGANYAINNLNFYDAITGELKKTIPFNKKTDSEGNDVSYYFTAMPVFH